MTARRLRSSRVARLALALLVSPIVACTQRTETTIPVAPNARVQIQNFTGSVRVRGWDRNAVRVVTAQGSRDEVRIQGRDSALSIATVSRSGVPGPLDYEISVPTGASVAVVGTYTDIGVDGVHGGVSAATVQGDVTLRRGDGVISLKSVEGTVTVQDATGRIAVNGVNKGIVLRNVNGEIAAETVNGAILLDGIESSVVDAETVNGRVTYAGAIRDHGRYRFASHAGSIVVSIPEHANASIVATTYQGTFASHLGVPNDSSDQVPQPRRRANFAVGNGSARVELESFQGSLILARPGEIQAR